MNKTVVVVGSAWGDEGKGKITNYLSEECDMVVRYQGGDNAGHTIVFGGNTYKLHLIPSGIFNPNIKNVLGNGMVINPKNLLKELNELKSLGFACTNLYISDRANVIFDYHLQLDGLKEEALGERKIGTTKKGIGPAYTDKVARTGIRMIDFISENFKDILKTTVTLKNQEISLYHGDTIDFEQTYQEYVKLALELKPYIVDSISLINDELERGKKILFEGAQGALLDIDFGTYPFVTSSNPSGGGVCIGSGVGPTKINEIIGVVKAYNTRVGSGAFPTEFEDSTSRYIREKAHEYGVTTKRPRRIGWFDGVLIRYSARINGLTGIVVTLLDVLSTIKELKICESYTLDGKIIKTIPARIEDFERCIPNFITLPGWNEDITGVTSFEELPINAQNYLKKLSELAGVPVVMFSVGPDKLQTIVRKELF